MRSYIVIHCSNAFQADDTIGRNPNDTLQQTGSLRRAGINGTNIRNAEGQLLEAVIDFPSNERRLLPQLDLRGPRIEPLASRCPASVASS